MARKTGSHAETTGPRVRAAAERLIARHGFAAVSMRQIAAELVMQAGALYLYTPDKQTLLFDIMRQHMEETLAAVEGMAGGGSPLERLEQLTRFHVRWHLDRPERVFIAYMELRSLNEEHFEAVRVLRRDYEAQWVTVLANGAEAGAFRVAAPRVAAMGVSAMLTGVTTWYRDGGRLTREEIEDQFCDMVRQAVCAV